MSFGQSQTQSSGTISTIGEVPVDGPRERLIAAMTRAAAERSYAHTTIDQVARYAGVSSEIFYEHFDNRDQCLLAAYDSFFERLMEDIEGATETAQSWPQRIKLALGYSLGFFAETASISRVFVVEAMSLGPAAIERRFAWIDRIAESLKSGRGRYPAARSHPQSMEQTLIAGVGLLISAHLLAEEPHLLPSLESELVELVLTPYVGAGEAKQIAAG